MRPQNRKISILVAEDDDDDVLLIRELVREGFYDGVTSVHVAESYATAFSDIEKFKYDVFLITPTLADLSKILKT